MLAESSLVRHLKRCLADIPRSSRQKSCTQCSHARTRCNLKRPRCARCAKKQWCCEYPPKQQEEEEEEGRTGKHPVDGQSDISDRLRTKVTLPPGGAYPSTSASNLSDASSGAIVAIPDSPPLSIAQGPIARLPGVIRRAVTVQQHGLNQTMRVLRTYPLMVAHRTQFPPFVHQLQVSDAIVPPALSKCYDILATWGGFSSQNAAIEKHILAEMDALVESVSNFQLAKSASAAFTCGRIDLPTLNYLWSPLFPLRETDCHRAGSRKQ